MLRRAIFARYACCKGIAAASSCALSIAKSLSDIFALAARLALRPLYAHCTFSAAVDSSPNRAAVSEISFARDFLLKSLTLAKWPRIIRWIASEALRGPKMVSSFIN
jgi:hypothetical protein